MINSFKKKSIKLLLSSAVVMSSVIAPALANAQSYDELINQTDIQIESLSAQQATLVAELAVAYEKIEELKTEAEALQSDIATDNETIQSLTEEVEKLEEIIANRETLLAEQARAVQVSGASTNYLNYVASAQDVSDFVGRVDVVRKMVTANKDLITTQEADKEAVEAKKVETKTTLDSKNEKLAELEALKGSLEEYTTSSEETYAQLVNDISLAQSTKDALVAEKAAYEEAQRIAAEQAAAQAAAQQAAQEAAALQAQAEADAAAAAQAQADAQVAVEAAEQAEALAAGQVVTEPIVEEAEPAPVVEAEVTGTVEEVNTEAIETAYTAPEVAESPVDVVAEAPVPAETEVAEGLAYTAPEVVESPAYVETEVIDPAPVATEYDSQAYVAQEAEQAALEAQAQAQAAQEAASQAQAAAEAEAEAARQRAAEAQANAEAAAAQAAQSQSDYDRMIAVAEAQLGTPYVWGGRNPGGFDCSGFVQYVYKETYGKDIGSWTGAQEHSGTRIAVEDAQPGDLYFWGSPGSTYHVAIATGDGNYIHASQPGTPLEYNKVSSYFNPSFALRVH